MTGDDLMRSKQILIVVASVMVGILLGFLLTRYQGRRSLRMCERELLYGTPASAFDAAMQILEPENNLAADLYYIFGDYRGRPPIPPDNKIVAARVIAHSESFHLMLVSLALGSLEDQNLDVRRECLKTIEQFYREPFSDALAMLIKTLHKEQDAELQKEKRHFLESALFARSTETERIRDMDTERFQKECRIRLGLDEGGDVDDSPAVPPQDE